MPVEYTLIQDHFSRKPDLHFMMQASSYMMLVGEISIIDREDSRAHLARIYVAPEWRGFKIGKELLNRGEKWALSRGIITLFGIIGAEFNRDMEPEQVRARMESLGYVFEKQNFSKVLK